MPTVDDECTICLQALGNSPSDGDPAGLTTAWGHVTNNGIAHTFHAACLQRWLQEATACPICRQVDAEWQEIDLWDVDFDGDVIMADAADGDE